MDPKYESSSSARSRRRRLRGSGFALGLLAASPCLMAPGGARAQASPAAAPTVAAASSVELAERYAADAFEAYGRKDYARAIVLYEQALAAAPSADIIYNIARVYDVGLRDRRRAIEHYERYMADPDALPERLEGTSKRLEELRAAEHASTLEHAALAEPPTVTEARNIDAIARDFPLDVAPPPPRPLAPSPADKGGGLGALEVAGITTGTAGLIGIGIGVGFGLSARAEDGWRDACTGNECQTQSAVEAAETAAQRANVATLGFAVGGGLLALGAVLWLLDSDSDPEADVAGLQLAPSADGSSLGGTLRGQF